MSEGISYHIRLVLTGLARLEAFTRDQFLTEEKQDEFDLIYNGVEKHVSKIVSFAMEIDEKLCTSNDPTPTPPTTPTFAIPGDLMPPVQHFPPPAGIKAPPLSFATRVGDLLFISGIPGFDANGDLPDGFEAQFANVVTNIRRVLDEAGATFRDLAKVNVLLTRAADVATMNKLYAEAFGPAPYPARTTCVVAALPGPAMLIEIEGVAALKT